ncbi:MAG: hypothetical protein WCK78_17585 [Paludibacter sp.]
MSDKLVELVRSEDYLLRVFVMTKDAIYTTLTKELIKFISNIYRIIEPSHINGKIIAFYSLTDEIAINVVEGTDFYDNSILNYSFKSAIFQLFQSDKMSLIYQNLNDETIVELLSNKSLVTYYYCDGKESIFVNGEEVKIINKYSCPSIFALQFHFLNEVLLRYKNDRILKISCEHFRKSWADDKFIYFINKPEDSIQLSLSEYLKNSLRGVDVVREYNLNASKPVDVRVYWREANRAALIEVKLMGRSLKSNGEINKYEYGNERANDGMVQIKEYIDLVEKDSPSVINKGYLVVIDGRRNGVIPKINTITINNGKFFENIELVIDEDKKYHLTHPNIEMPIRMFARPICS